MSTLTASAGTPKPIRGWASRYRVLVALVLVSLFYGSAVAIMHDDTVSPIDEVVYLDYTFKVYEEGLVREGERFGDEVAQVVACEGVVPHGTFGQECAEGQAVNSEGMPNAGYSTGAPYTPIYFWMTRIVGDAIESISGLSTVTSWRLTGVLWLAATVALLVIFLRRQGLSETVTFVVGLLFIASPFAWWTYTYLSTDVTSVLFGAAVMLVVLEAKKGRLSPWWLLPIALAGALFKITNLIVLGLVLLFMVLSLLAKKSGIVSEGRTASIPPKRDTLLWAVIGASTLVAAAVQLAWMRLVPLLAVSETRVDQGVAAALSPTELIGLAVSGIAGPITHNPAAGIFPTGPFASIAAPLGWVLVAGVVGSIMIAQPKESSTPLIWATGLASILALPALGVVFWLTTGSYFSLPARYAATLIPAQLLLVGMLLRSKAAAIVFIGYAVLLMGTGGLLAVHIGRMF